MSRREEVLADDIVNGIVADIAERKGLGNEWDELPGDIQADIRAAWWIIAHDALNVLSGGC